jgi:hypothetical protein
MAGSPLQQSAMLQQQQQQQQQQQGMPGGGFLGQQQGWHGFEAPMVDGQSPSDSWSTGSAQGQPVPTALNVEDW